MEVTYDGCRAVMTHGEHVHNYVRQNGVYFKASTPLAVVRCLLNARETGDKLRLHYGHTSGPRIGLDWMEENDVEGRIGNSTGFKVPLLVEPGSRGGPFVLDDCIVKITGGKRVLYQHPAYHRPAITLRPVAPGEKCGETDLCADGYKYAVCYDGVVAACFKNESAAKRFVKKMS